MISEDYDYTIDKYLIPKVHLRCPMHNKENASFICTEAQCRRQCVVCKSCQVDMADHYREHKQYFKNIDSFIVEITNDMENAAHFNKQALQEVYNQTPNLQKWQEDDEQHLRKVEAHISAQKMMIDEDMEQLNQLLTTALQGIKIKVSQKLDKFFASYCEVFNQQKNSLNENFGLAKSFHFYTNPSNLVSKLHSEMPAQASEFLSKLYKSVEKAKQIQLNKQSIIQNFRQMNFHLNQMTDNLPFYISGEQMPQTVQGVSNLIEEYFSKHIILPEQANQMVSNLHLNYNSNNTSLPIQQISTQPSSTGSASYISQISPSPVPQTLSPMIKSPVQNNFFSENINNNSSDQKPAKQVKVSRSCKKMQIKNNDQYVSIKPIKKYQLDIPICSIAALSENTFALASVGDTKIKIFDSSTKTMNTYLAHKSPLTYLSKVRAVFLGDTINQFPRYDELSSNSNNPSGKILIASASSDLSVLLLQHDCNKVTPPIQYSRISGFSATPQCILDLQDGVHIATGDNIGEVQIWNYHDQRLIQSVRGKHSSKIIGMHLIKVSKTLIVVSEDSISIQRLIYGTSSLSQQVVGPIERISQEAYILCDFQIGKISSFLSTYREGICFIGNNDGDLIIFDFLSKRIIKKWNSHRGPIIDLCLFEFGELRNIGTLVSLGLSDKQVKSWRITSDDRNNTFNVEDFTLLDGNSANDDISSKNKIQIVPGISPKLIISNERDKELLVYNLIF